MYSKLRSPFVKMLQLALVVTVLVFGNTTAQANLEPSDDPPPQLQVTLPKPVQTVRVGVYNFKPLVFTGADGRAQGLYIDVLQYIAVRENWNIEYVPCKWADCLAATERGDLDILPSVGYTKERAVKLDYTHDYLFMDWGVIYAHKNQTMDSVLALEGKQIAVLKGSIYTEDLRALLDSFDIHAQLIEKSEYTEVLAAVNSGEIEAGVITKMYGLELENHYPQVRPTRIYFSPIKIYFALPKGKDPQLLKTLNEYLMALKADPDSAYYQSFDRWMGFAGTAQGLPWWALWVLGGMGILFCASVLFVILLRRQVEARTRLLAVEIIERRQAEEALRASEARFKTIFEHANDAIHIANAQDEILDVNSRACSMLGYSRDELLRMRIADLQAPEHRASGPIAQTEMAKYGNSLFEGLDLHRDGRRIPVEISVSQIDSPQGVLYISIVRDITERKQAEAALRESEINLNTLIENTDGSIWAVDSHYRLIIGNREFHHNTSAVLGRRLNTGESVLLPLFPPDVNALWQGNYDRALQGETFSIEVLTHFRSAPRHIEYRFSPIRPNESVLDEIHGVTIYGRDITERKLAEQQIHAALAEKEMLLRELNHRTKNNLNLVGALIELQAASSNNQAFQGLAKTLKDRLHSISLVHQMLYRSRNLAQIDLGDYAREIAAHLASSFMTAPGKIQVDIDAVPVALGIDAAIPCGQILNELLTNAFKYAFPEGRSGCVSILIRQAQDGEILLRVSDNGVGLPTGFDEMRSDSLGMNIVRMLAAQLGGSLAFERSSGFSCEIRFREKRRSLNE